MSEIEFGKVEIREPKSQKRPDRNRKFAVVACGEIDQSELPIFVDLDVMRDMEGHARTNTHVELGGVMLGGKFIDEEGRSFVVVKEALRAEHYEATRGSFKFTHDTWAQISRDREQFPDDLHLVGWYHTHPDWGVFLSGMDMFICDNFFNDELDVALVIDPCRGDRGWFFWDDQGEGKKKRRTAGFYLVANRYRRTELLQFANALATTDPAYFDPRYETPRGESAMQPVVNIHDQKSPVLMVAVLGMLTIQMLVLGLLAWRMLLPPDQPVSYAQEQRNGIYREILGQLVAPAGENGEAANASSGTRMIAQIERLASQNLGLKTDVEGRDLLVRDLTNRHDSLKEDYEKKNVLLTEKKSLVSKHVTEIGNLKAKLETEEKVNADIKEGKTIGGPSWWIVGAMALATAMAGLFGGTMIGRRIREDELDDYHRESRIPSPGDKNRGPASKPDSRTVVTDDSPDLRFGDSSDADGESAGS